MAENGDLKVTKVENKPSEPSQEMVSKLTSQLMSNPNVLAAFGKKLETIVGQKSMYMENLPNVIKRRLRALKRLQLDMFNVESKFYEDVHNLECKYAEQYQPLFEKRKNIINANWEPTDSECEWKSDDEEDGASKKDEGEEAKVPQLEVKSLDDENTKGIPEFWLTIFKNVEALASLMEDHDEPVLKFLQDIKVNYKNNPHMSFELVFYFKENDYFTNSTLTKEYVLRSEPDPKNPMEYDGPEIVKSIGCSIDWKKGKNLTVKTIKQKQKGRGGAKKLVTKTVKADSFFNFFNPPKPKLDEDDKDSDDEEDDSEREHAILADYELGQMLQSSIIPKAVLYFTGEAIGDDGEGEDEDYEDGEDGAEEGEDNDPDYKPPADGAAKGQDCKQQ